MDYSTPGDYYFEVIVFRRAIPSEILAHHVLFHKFDTPATDIRELEPGVETPLSAFRDLSALQGVSAKRYLATHPSGYAGIIAGELNFSVRISDSLPEDLSDIEIFSQIVKIPAKP